MPAESGFQIEGLSRWHAALTRRMEMAAAADRKFIATGAHVIERNAKKRAGEGGRHAKGTPTPATPGGGPAVISGTLRRSIRSKIDLGAGVARIGPTVIYGRRVELEYNYPYLRPAVQDSLPELILLSRKLYREVLHG